MPTVFRLYGDTLLFDLCFSFPFFFCVHRHILHSFMYSKHVKDMGLGIFIVQQHEKSKYGNRVTIRLPDAEGQGGLMECSCDVPSRYRLPCQDVMAALRCELPAGPYTALGSPQCSL